MNIFRVPCPKIGQRNLRSLLSSFKCGESSKVQLGVILVERRTEIWVLEFSGARIIFFGN